MYFLILLIFLLLIPWKGKAFAFFFLISSLFLSLNFIPLFVRLLIYFTLFISFYILSIFKMKSGNRFDMYFGLPGSGKTTFAAWLVKKSKRKCFSNVPIKSSFKISKSDIGIYDISDSELIFDECGLEFNNRSFKTNFTPEQLEFFKLHRHYNVNIYMFSQGWNDADKKLRDITKHLYYVQRSFIPFFIKRREIVKYLGVNKTTQQIDDLFKFKLFSSYYIFSPSLWKMFDTTEKRELLHKDFKKWNCAITDCAPITNKLTERNEVSSLRDVSSQPVGRQGF